MTDAENELRASRIGEPCKASPKSRSRNRDAVDRCRGSDLLEPRFWSFRFANPPPERGDHFGESLPRRSPTEPESVSIYAVISTRLPSVSLTTAS